MSDKPKISLVDLKSILNDHTIAFADQGVNLGQYRTEYACVMCREPIITDGHDGISRSEAILTHQADKIEKLFAEAGGLDDEERTELARLRVIVEEVEAITADLRSKCVNPWVSATGYVHLLEKALGLGKFKLPVEGGAKFMATLRGDEDSHHQFVTLTGGGEVFYRKLDPSKLSFYTEERLRYFYEDFREVGE